MTTFAVDKVSSKHPKLRIDPKTTENFTKKGLVRLGVKEVEASNFNAAHDSIRFERPENNSFLMTVLHAYNDHVALTFAPDDLWLVCAQAVTKHIELNAEDARKALVSFEGKKTLEIRVDDFVKGSPDNDWQRAFGQFGDQIEKHLGKKRNLFDPTFSTTTPVEKAAIQAQMMSALAPYFEYRASTLCGIPHITLLGTVEDWEAIVSRVVAFGEFMPAWANVPMVRVATEFLLAKKGDVNPDFWQNFFKESGGSGGPYINGYINGLFPYLDNHKNHMLVDKDGNPCFEQRLSEKRSFGGATLGSFPGSVSTVPVIWQYYSTKYDMQLATGLFGTRVDSESYRPVIGWAIGEAQTPPKDEER